MALDRNQILMHANALGELLAQTEEVQQFKAAEENLLKNEQAYVLLRKLHSAQEGTNPEDIDPTDPEIAKVLDELDSIPEVIAFQDAQSIVDALLSTVSEMIADSMTTHAGLHRAMDHQ